MTAPAASYAHTERYIKVLISNPERQIVSNEMFDSSFDPEHELASMIMATVKSQLLESR